MPYQSTNPNDGKTFMTFDELSDNQLDSAIETAGTSNSPKTFASAPDHGRHIWHLRHTQQMPLWQISASTFLTNSLHI